MIPFNKPSIVGRELAYMQAAVETGKISGNGVFTGQCHHFFEQHFGFYKSLLTHSGTGALEMAALLLNIQPGDEVIMPTYTFVSTANAFLLRGAHIVFVDSAPDHPNMDVHAIEPLITERTKCIVVMHYGGYAVDMQVVLDLSVRYRLFIIEDAAHGIGARYNGLPLGSIGHLAAFSFHETKNVQCGEGGMLVVNDERFSHRAEVVWEKGTNRAAFARKETDTYHWIDIGSSFLPSELTAAYLLGQTEHFESICLRRRAIWEQYSANLQFGPANSWFTLLPETPGSVHNHHIVAIICRSASERESLIRHLDSLGIMAVSHYRCLHDSPYYKGRHDGRKLSNAKHFEDCLLRLPIYHDLTEAQVEEITKAIYSFYSRKS